MRSLRAKPFAVLAGLGIALAIALVPGPLHGQGGVGDRPALAAAVVALMICWWFLEALPFAWTALVPLLAFPLLDVHGVGPARGIALVGEQYVDAYIFLFIGGSAIGCAMELSHLHRRVALHIMRAVGTRPRRLLFGMLLSTAAVSLWISNTATAVMMLPIALALLRQLEGAAGGRRLEHLGTALLLAVAYASNIGGIGTKIGTATNSILFGYLADELGYDLGFLRYLGIGLPFAALLLPIAWLLLWQIARRDGLSEDVGRGVIDAHLQALGAVRPHERRVAAIFAVAALLWIAGDLLRPAIGPSVQAALHPLLGPVAFSPKHYEASVAVSALVALLLAGSLTWRQLAKLPWGTIVLLGGSFAMASAIEGSGLSRQMAHSARHVASWSLTAQLFLTSVVTIALSAVATNTATVNLTLNLLPQSPVVLTTSAMAASCDFALPTGTPPNAIVFGAGYIRLPTMMVTGFVLDLVAALALALYMLAYGRWLL